VHRISTDGGQERLYGTRGHASALLPVAQRAAVLPGFAYFFSTHLR
jgi:hypothetical protein